MLTPLQTWDKLVDEMFRRNKILWLELLSRTVPAIKLLLARTVPAKKLLPEPLNVKVPEFLPENELNQLLGWESS